MAGVKNLGPGATTANELLRVSDINTITSSAPTPQFPGDRWYNDSLGKEYIAILNAGATLVWVEVAGGSTGAGETTFGAEASRPTSGAFIGHNYYAQDTKRRFEWDGGGWICILEPEKSYSVTLTAVSGNPNIGTLGTANGLWMRQNGRAKWRINVTFAGTGVTAGTGLWRIPIPIAEEAIPGAFGIVGGGWYYCTGGFTLVECDSSPGSNKARMIVTNTAGAGAAELSSTYPAAPGNGSVLTLSGEYTMDDRYA